jgi:uncharacterized protein GlcG (DUF336 family)
MIRVASSILIASGLTIVLAISPLISQGADNPPGHGRATTDKRSVTAEAALAIAQVALKTAKEKGNEVAVAVVDQEGIPLVVLRSDYGTEQFVTGAIDKAWTAVNFKASTREVFETIKDNKEDNSQLPHAARALFLMGGVPLKEGGTVVGAVGVAGFASGLDDDTVAQKSAQAFEVMLRK